MTHRFCGNCFHRYDVSFRWVCPRCGSEQQANDPAYGDGRAGDRTFDFAITVAGRRITGVIELKSGEMSADDERRVKEAIQEAVRRLEVEIPTGREE